MGKTKSKAIRKSANILLEKKVKFSKDFETNKKILSNMTIGKKLRNQMAGLISRIKKNEKLDMPTQ